MLKERVLDWWGGGYHQRRMDVVEAALRKAGDRGRTRDEHVRTALRKLREQSRAETDGDRWRARDPERGDAGAPLISWSDVEASRN